MKQIGIVGHGYYSALLSAILEGKLIYAEGGDAQVMTFEKAVEIEKKHQETFVFTEPDKFDYGRYRFDLPQKKTTGYVGNSQRKRRKLIRKNPCLLRSKKYR